MSEDNEQTPCNLTCPVHTELFSSIKVLINQQTTVCDDIKEIRTDIRDAIALAQEGIVQNTKDAALLKQRVDQLYDERPVLFKVVSYKNRVIGAFGVVGILLTVFGLKIFGGT